MSSICHVSEIVSTRVVSSFILFQVGLRIQCVFFIIPKHTVVVPLSFDECLGGDVVKESLEKQTAQFNCCSIHISLKV